MRSITLHAAWDWLVRTRRPAELMRLAEGLVWYWWISGRNRQGVQALEKLAPLLEQPDELPTGVMRLRHSLWSALLMDWDFEAVAHAPLEQLAADIEPLERLGCDLRAERGLLLFLQSEAVRNTDRVLAQVLNRQAIELFEAAGRRWECANALNQATNLAIDLGQMQAAQATIRQSYAIFQELGDPLQTSAALERLAHLEWVQGGSTKPCRCCARRWSSPARRASVRPSPTTCSSWARGWAAPAASPKACRSTKKA